MKKVKAIKAHKSKFKNPIKLSKNELLKVFHTDSEYPEWIWTATRDGNSGWAPVSILDINKSDMTAISKEDYYAKELDTQIDEVFTVNRELNGWYLVSNSFGEYGWIPKDTVKEITTNTQYPFSLKIG